MVSVFLSTANECLVDAVLLNSNMGVDVSFLGDRFAVGGQIVAFGNCQSAAFGGCRTDDNCMMTRALLKD